MNNAYAFNKLGVRYNRVGDISLAKIGSFTVYERVGDLRRFLSFITIEFKHEL
jgi:hypothetical protein